jgi:BON domain
MQAASPRPAGAAGHEPVTDQPPAIHPSDPDLAQRASLAHEPCGPVPDDQVPDDQVKVIARDGWLILAGQVDTPSRKHPIAAAIEGLDGIRRLRNDIAFAKDVLADRVHQQLVEDFTFDARVGPATPGCRPMARRSC